MNIAGIFKTALPFISTALEASGPLGAIASSFINTATGGKDADKAFAEASANPEIMLALRKAEHDFQEHMTQLGIDSIAKLEDIAASDRASARAREIAVRDKTPMLLALCIIFGFFGLLMVLVFRDVPPGVHDLLVAMVGVLGAAFTAIVSYYYGSSSGSAEKTRLLSAQSARQ